MMATVTCFVISTIGWSICRILFDSAIENTLHCSTKSTSFKEDAENPSSKGHYHSNRSVSLRDVTDRNAYFIEIEIVF